MKKVALVFYAYAIILFAVEIVDLINLLRVLFMNYPSNKVSMDMSIEGFLVPFMIWYLATKLKEKDKFAKHVALLALSFVLLASTINGAVFFKLGHLGLHGLTSPLATVFYAIFIPGFIAIYMLIKDKPHEGN